MHKSFSLIELIFTIVIIALIFTTIPKIMYATNQTFKFTLKEDGIFNMMAKTLDVSNQEWDENNTNSQDPATDILVQDSGSSSSSSNGLGGLGGGNNGNSLLSSTTDVLACDADNQPYIRVGGFYSGDNYSRICKPKDDGTKITISHIGTDSNENSAEDYDDEDDFNGTEVDVSKNGVVRYKIYIDVSYTNEWNDSCYNTDTRTLDFNFTNNSVDASNIKIVQVRLYDKKYDKNVSFSRYWSANIGLIPEIESSQW